MEGIRPGYQPFTGKSLYGGQGSGICMSNYRKVIKLKTKGEGDMIDISTRIKDAVSESGLSTGLACAFIPGSTAAIITIEYEPGLESDMRDALERLLPKGIEYEHHKRWGDDNGHSHIRASFLSSSVTVPFHNGAPDFGTWQQAVLIESDTRPRSREVIIQMVGDDEQEVQQ